MPLNPIIEVTLDFETANTNGLDLKITGAWRYAEDIFTEITWASFSIGDEAPREWTPYLDTPANSEALADLRALALNSNTMFTAHNAGFEKAIWRCIMMPMFEMPDIPNGRWHCTQAVCAMKVLPQDLDRAVLVLRLPAKKDKVGSALAKSLSKPNKKTGLFDRTPATLRTVGTYCSDDVRAEIGLHKRVGWLPPGERRVWLLNQRVNERGIRLDMEFVRAAQQVVDKATLPLAAEFTQITEGLEFTQVAKLTKWARDNGAAIPNLNAETMKALGIGEDEDDDNTDQDTASEGDGSYPALPSSVHRALTIRKLIGSASIKKLARMQQCVGSDGRARGLLQYHGTGPGRSAGRLLQPHNFPRGSLKDALNGDRSYDPDFLVNAILSGDPSYVEAVIGRGAVECVVSSLRHALVPDPHRVFIAGDYAGIQARTVLGFAGQHDKTAIMAAGKDIYIDMAEQIYKRPIDKKKDPAERQTGKNSVLGLGFQMGWKKFKLKYAKDLSDEFCEEVVRVYRKEWAPLVPKLWYGLEHAAVRAVWDRVPTEYSGIEYRLEDGWLTARLPSGRKLWYFNPQPIKKTMPWDDDDVRCAFTYDAMKMGQWRTIDAFGGQLTENVVMGIERDIMTNGQIKCEAEGFPVVLEVHDEIVVEPEEWAADEKAFSQIMEDVPAWVRELQIPVAVETWSGDRYRK